MKRVAVIGFGFMGMTHALNILKNKDLQLTAIVNKNPEAVKETLSSATGNIETGHFDPDVMANVKTYTGFDECLEKETLDAVHLCVHTDLHYEMTKKALLRGKHVFLEKPFCLDVREAEELIALAEQQQKILMIGHVVRFMPPYQKLKEWVDSGEFGELNFLSLKRFSGVPAWGQWKEARIRKTSGGALFDLVIHDIDFCSYVLGSPAGIQSNCLPGELSEQDYISAWWSYQGKGTRVRIEGGNIFHANFPFRAGYMARFEKASVSYSSMKGDVIQIADDTHIREVPAGDAGLGYYNEIDYFAGCMKNGTPPALCSPESSLQTVQLCYKHLFAI